METDNKKSQLCFTSWAFPRPSPEARIAPEKQLRAFAFSNKKGGANDGNG
jgi:hypothetical protein